jgi:hypothetical protein
VIGRMLFARNINTPHETIQASASLSSSAEHVHYLSERTVVLR